MHRPDTRWSDSTDIHATGKPRGFEKPVGVRDYLPEDVRRLRMVERRIGKRFSQWGYDEVITPTLEYFDSVGGASATLESKLFKLMDKHGRALVLRPDMTTPIARVVASVLHQESLPIRLYYQANVFRAQENEAGRSAEFKQTGAELIGDASPDGDAEMLALAVSALRACGIESFKLAIGHVGFLNAFIRERVRDEAALAQLKSRLNDCDYVGYRRHTAQYARSAQDQHVLNDLLLWRGDADLLRERMKNARSEQEKTALRHLMDLWRALEAYGVARHVILDLSLISKMNYYTGVYFEGYAAHHGFPLLSGGRYDSLLAQFGRPAAAVGFQLKMDRTLEASPLTTEQPRHYLVAYEPVKRPEALQTAETWRQEGIRVTVQVIDTPGADVSESAWRERFDHVIVLRGDDGGRER